MAQDVYSGYPCSFAYGAGGASTLSLPQLRGVDLSTGKALSEVIAGGDVDRKAVILSHADPRIGITSADLSAILAVMTTGGLAITGAATFQLQQRASGGTFTGGSTYVAVTNSVGGFLGINTINARQDDTNGAVCEMMYYPHSSDGLIPPLALASGQAAALPVPAFGSQFYLGPVYLGAAEVEGVQSVEVQFGLNYRLQRASGDVFARKGFIVSRRAVIRITFEKVTNVSSAAMFSAALGSTLSAYFWKGAPGGTRVALATAQHAKISATAGEWGADSISWSEDGDGNLVLTVMPTGALTTSVVSAIP